MRKRYSSNDDRSNALNPNNPTFKAGTDNRANQLNPQHIAYLLSRLGARSAPSADDWDPPAEGPGPEEVHPLAGLVGLIPAAIAGVLGLVALIHEAKKEVE